MLVKNEDLPGGLWHKLRAEERSLKQQFLAAFPGTAGSQALILAQVRRLETQRELCLKMFRYGLQLAPLLQPPPAEGPDRAKQWNLFWSGGYGLSLKEEQTMSRSLVEEAASIAQIFDDAREAPDEPTDTDSGS